MSNIKIIYYNQFQISQSEIERKIDALQMPRYSITSGLMLVRTERTVGDTYKLINIPQKRLLVVAMDKDKPAYWGYMSNSLWDWLKKYN